MLEPLADIVTKPPTPPDWLVPGMLHKGTVVILAGEAGIGKSTLTVTLSMCLATGLPFMGLPIPQGRVLYYDEENSVADGHEYIRWAWRGLGRPDPKLLDNFRLHRFSLRQPTQFAQMRQDAGEWRPNLIVMDTVTPCCSILDENDNAEASRALSQIRAVLAAAAPGCVMLLLKHAKLDYTDGHHSVRGAKAWIGSTDATIYHLGVTGRPRKDGLRPSRLEPGKTRAFGLQEEWRIMPEWSGEGDERGLVLRRG